MSSLATPGNPFLQGVISTLVFAAALVALRFALARYLLRRQSIPAEDRHWWVVTVRNTLMLVFLVGLVFIWAEELRSFAVSLVAVAVAFAIATKELLLCLTGTFLRTVTRSHSVGDHIELGDASRVYRGYVVDQTMLSTVIEATGPGESSRELSGRRVVLPNSWFVTAPLGTDRMVGRYTTQTLTVPLTVSADLEAAERTLLRIAQEECAEVLARARQGEGRGGGPARDDAALEPRVSPELPAPERVNLLLRIPVPVRGEAGHAQRILRRFVTEFYGPRSEGMPARPGS